MLKINIRNKRGNKQNKRKNGIHIWNTEADHWRKKKMQNTKIRIKVNKKMGNKKIELKLQ